MRTGRPAALVRRSLGRVPTLSGGATPDARCILLSPLGEGAFEAADVACVPD